MRSQLLNFSAKSNQALICSLLVSHILTSLVALPASAQLKNAAQAAEQVQKQATKTPTNQNKQTIVVFGDSLSAGYGLSQNQSWVALMQAQVSQQKWPYQIINASISGETTSSGLARFKQMLSAHRPQIVILELGANDGLRGLPVAQMRDNLSAMITLAKASQTKVLLLGMKIPPNYGKKYTQDFSETYPLLAKQHQIDLVPFLLEGVAGHRQLIQNDGLHPLATAQPQLLANVWQPLKQMAQP